jgi:hypothetical protein
MNTTNSFGSQACNSTIDVHHSNLSFTLCGDLRVVLTFLHSLFPLATNERLLNENKRPCPSKRDGNQPLCFIYTRRTIQMRSNRSCP